MVLYQRRAYFVRCVICAKDIAVLSYLLGLLDTITAGYARIQPDICLCLADLSYNSPVIARGHSDICLLTSAFFNIRHTFLRHTFMYFRGTSDIQRAAVCTSHIPIHLAWIVSKPSVPFIHSVRPPRQHLPQAKYSKSITIAPMCTLDVDSQVQGKGY